jgi:hypothetical protein
MKNCCDTNVQDVCIRSDGTKFNLPRKFTKNICLTKKNRGFSMRSSCAPYKKCMKGGKTKKTFLYNPKKSFDVYIDKDPSDTIHIKYTTVSDIEQTINKLERLYKTGKYTHKRIWQVGMIMKVRLEAIKKHKQTKYPNAKNILKRFNLSNKYFNFLGNRTKIKSESERKKLIFKHY